MAAPSFTSTLEQRKIMHNQLEYSSGFTLIELMVTIAIAAILIGIAIPSFTSTIASNRLTTNANEFVTALNLARSEAVKRGIQVSVTRKGTTSQEWKSGWDVFVDINGNEVFNDDGIAPLCATNTNGSPTEDCLLRTYAALPGGYTLRTGGSTYQNYAAYLPSGLSNVSVGDTFRLCNGSNTATSRAITINALGRARVSTSTASCP
jgi:type IV fimbrial biogenesis protein FimT